MDLQLDPGMVPSEIARDSTILSGTGTFNVTETKTVNFVSNETLTSLEGEKSGITFRRRNGYSRTS